MRKKRPDRRAARLVEASRRLFSRTVRQVGAIPYEVIDGEVRFVVVTSRGTGRWIFPKGGRMLGLDNAQAAAREALEEAGVEGVIAARRIGCYVARTRRGHRAEVSLYPLKVERVLDDWQERAERRRQWVSIAQARRLGMDAELVKLAERTRRRVTAG